MNRIAVTGAAGKTGQALVAAILAAGHEPIAYTHTEEQAHQIQSQSGATAVAVDLADTAHLADHLLTHRVEALYHIPPNMHPQEGELSRSVLRAAQAAQLERFVFHSVLHPDLPEMPHHLAKAQLEQDLIRSGLAWSTIRPASYIENTTLLLPHILETGVYEVPYRFDAPFTPVSLADVADAAVALMVNPAAAGGSFDIAGPEVLTPGDMAEQLSQTLGQQIAVRQSDPALWAKLSAEKGMHPDRIDIALAMFDFYDQHGFVGSPVVARQVLNRPLATFTDEIQKLPH